MRRRWRGQALAEMALVAPILVFLAMLGVTLVPLHRAHTAATAAAYACATFVTQYPTRPGRAAEVGTRAAERILQTGTWNALGNAHFSLAVSPPEGPGEVGACTVTYSVALPFDPFGLGDRTHTVEAVGRSERWKARW